MRTELYLFMDVCWRSAPRPASSHRGPCSPVPLMAAVTAGKAWATHLQLVLLSARIQGLYCLTLDLSGSIIWMHLGRISCSPYTCTQTIHLELYQSHMFRKYWFFEEQKMVHDLILGGIYFEKKWKKTKKNPNPEFYFISVLLNSSPNSKVLQNQNEVLFGDRLSLNFLFQSPFQNHKCKIMPKKAIVLK